MSDKTNGKLYKIKDNFVRGNKDSVEKINQIISIFNTNGDSSKFNEKGVNKTLESKYSFSLRLYSLVSDIDKKPDWKLFLDTITEDKNEELRSVNSSFLLFIFNTTDIYVLSRGYHGFIALNQFIEIDFGLDVISCLLKQNFTSIKGLSERRFFGDEFLTQRNFKGEYVLSYDDNFGKIYNEIIAEISDGDFEKLGIKQKKKNFNKASINVSNSLEITSSFNLEELINRIKKIDELLKKTKSKNKVSLNHFTKVNQTKLFSIKTKLEDIVLETCYESLTTGENKIDFFYKDLKKFLNSTKLSVIVKDGELLFETESIKSMSFLNVFNEFKDKLLLDTLDDFRKSIGELVLILELDNITDNTIETSINEWVNAEVEYDGKNYFKIDGDWYTFEDNLDSYLKNQISNIEFEKLTLTKLESWEETKPLDKKKGYHEGCFNSKHRDKENFIIGDKCFYKFIELADIIKIEDGNIFLYHVKRGIDRDLRVLSSQVLNSARILRYDLDDKLLEDYFEKIKKTQYKSKDIKVIKNSKTVKINKTDFKELFKENKFQINFVFAISSESDEVLKDQLIKSQSRIAKLAFLHTFKEMKKYDFNLFFELIKEV